MVEECKWMDGKGILGIGKWDVPRGRRQRQRMLMFMRRGWDIFGGEMADQPISV
jgi:hypothetical protein